MSSMLDWAKREVEIACKKENPERKDGEFDYGCACYESALKAFESLCNDGHSGASIGFTKAILNRLIDGLPLTPIEDTDDIWEKCSRSKNLSYVTYQCKRISSLFKDVYEDGHVKYSDVESYYCVNINNHNCTYRSGLVRQLYDKMFPINMPYMPGKPTAVFCEDFVVDKKNGDFDTVGIFYVLKDENGEQKRIDINRFFRVPEENEEGNWTEISEEEYYDRKDKRHVC